MTTSASANRSADHIPQMSPFDILAEELGAVAGRVERESALRITAALSDLRARDAERELTLTRFMQSITERIEARMALVRDGVDGAPGERGMQGERGLPGERGEQGLPGERGEQGLPGERGETGLQGLQGDRGERGEVGPPGQTGERGAPGERGIDGQPGTNGDNGLPGERGTPGERGLPGEPGERGLPGERGEMGPEGRLPVVKAWEDKVHYAGEVVSHEGSSWQAKRDTGTSPGSDDWNLIAARGFDGLSIKIKGTYDPNKKYLEHNVVACNGGSFVALKDSPGDCPGPDWQLIAGPGKRGDKGAPGDRGPKGDAGNEAASIVGWIVDEKAYTATPVMSDGDKAPAINMQEMFKQFLAETR